MDFDFQIRLFAKIPPPKKTTKWVGILVKSPLPKIVRLSGDPLDFEGEVSQNPGSLTCIGD